MGSVGNKNNTDKNENTFQSTFGFPNVGKHEVFTAVGGVGVKGTVIPGMNDIQEYLDSGKFDNYGTNARAKKTIVDSIIRDMRGRGFEVVPSEDGVKFLPDGETSLAISLGRSGDKWVLRQSKSAGTTQRGGMRGTLDRISQRK